MISEAVYRVQKVDGRQRMVVHYNRLKDANQERIAMTDTPTNEGPNLAADTVTDTEPEEVSATDNQSANLENITEQTRGLVIPSRMTQKMNPDAIPVIATEDLVGGTLPNLDAEQETIFNNDLVGVREYRHDLNNSVSTSTDTSSTSVEDLNENQQLADMGESNSESDLSKNSVTDAWVGYETRAGRKTRKPAHLRDFVTQ